jgi:hypothetical protein
MSTYAVAAPAMPSDHEAVAMTMSTAGARRGTAPAAADIYGRLAPSTASAWSVCLDRSETHVPAGGWLGC